MTTVSNATSHAAETFDRTRLLKEAVHQSRALSIDGALERLFTLAFRNLVYAQIWEDPVVDMEALELNCREPDGGHRVWRLQCDELLDRATRAHNCRRSQ